jgi:hypothetical protein
MCLCPRTHVYEYERDRRRESAYGCRCDDVTLLAMHRAGGSGRRHQERTITVKGREQRA